MVEELLCIIFVFCGPDDLGSAVLKQVSMEIGPVLQKIYTKSIQTHIIPSDWKKARICPIFKRVTKIDLRATDQCR